VSGGTASRSANTVILYDSTGAFVAAAADQASSWNSTGVKTMALGHSVTLSNTKIYYAAVLCTGTTPISPSRAALASLANVGLTAANLKYATNGTGLTKLPGSITPGSNSGTNACRCGWR
jgi:hypothetical protein